MLRAAGGWCGAVALVLAACGGGTDVTTLVRKASPTTLATKAAHFTVAANATAMTTTGQRTISETGEGVVDFVSGSVDVTFNRPAQQGTPGRNQETVIIGDDVWASTPPSVSAANPAAKPFLHTTLAHRNANPLSLLTQPDDPTRFLRELSGYEPGSVKRIGTDTVRGSKATHVQLRVDLDQAAAKDANAKPQAEALRSLLGTNIIPVDLWVDGKGRAVRLRVTLQHLHVSATAGAATTTTTVAGAAVPANQGGLEVDLVMTNEFFDFGKPVHIAPPPGDQVTEFTA